MAIQFNMEKLGWLLAIPACLVSLYFFSQWRKRALKQLADSRLLPTIFSAPKNNLKTRQTIALVLALALLSVAMLNPARPRSPEGRTLSGFQMIIAIDVSRSMLAADMRPSRLSLAKNIARKLADTLAGSQMGLVAFAGESWLQLPVTADLQAVRLALADLDESSIPLEGTDLEMALSTCRQAMPMAGSAHPVVVLLTDGEELQGNGLKQASEIKKDGIKLLVGGIGTIEGATVPDEQGNVMRSEEGTAVISSLKLENLETLAREANGAFIHARQAEAALKSMLPVIQQLPRAPMTNSRMQNLDSYSHWLIALALVLLLYGTWPRGIKRKSGLFLLLLPLPFWGHGQENAREMQRLAEQHYQRQQWQQAETLYRQLKTKPGLEAQSFHQLGNIAFRTGLTEKAIACFEKASMLAERPNRKAAAFNNLGLALAQAGRHPEAIRAFTLAVKQSPEDEVIQKNLAKALLDGKQQPPHQTTEPKKQPENKNAEEKLKALEEEEKKLRQQRARQRSSQRQPGNKNW
jgi:Ca-activated chloride channel family protein